MVEVERETERTGFVAPPSQLDSSNKIGLIPEDVVFPTVNRISTNADHIRYP